MIPATVNVAHITKLTNYLKLLAILKKKLSSELPRTTDSEGAPPAVPAAKARRYMGQAKHRQHPQLLAGFGRRKEGSVCHRTAQSHHRLPRRSAHLLQFPTWNQDGGHGSNGGTCGQETNLFGYDEKCGWSVPEFPFFLVERAAKALQKTDLAGFYACTPVVETTASNIAHRLSYTLCAGSRVCAQPFDLRPELSPCTTFSNRTET